MQLQRKIQKYTSLNLEEDYKGFEGSENNSFLDRKLQIAAVQIDLNKKNSTFTPSLQIIMKDTSVNNGHRRYDIKYDYFFDGEGKFITGLCNGYIGKPLEYFGRKRLDSLEHLNNNGESIKDILNIQKIPEQLLEYEVIKSLRDNTLNTSDYDKKEF